MAQVLINGITDEEKRQLQTMAGLTAMQQSRRVSASGLAREIIKEWLADNLHRVPPADHSPQLSPPTYLT